MKTSDKTMGNTMKATVIGRINRTGVGTSPVQSKEMIEGARSVQVTLDGAEALAIRLGYQREAEPVGSVPPPTTLKGMAKTTVDVLKGADPTFLIDKLAERLAFERGGTRLYELLIRKLEGAGSFLGGPQRRDLELIRAEEHAHFVLLRSALADLGADFTVMTPSADLVGVESMGLVQVLADPRTTLGDGLHAILVAELADRDGWELLIDTAQRLGHTALVDPMREALAQETEHLAKVRTWVLEHARNSGRFVSGQSANEDESVRL